MKGNDEPKVYVVWSGRETGVFDNWDDCKPLVVGVKGAKYKSFKGITHAEAERILADGPEQYYGTGTKKEKEPAPNYDQAKASISPDAIAVDASSQGNPGRMEYRGVYVETGDEVFHSLVYPRGTNNIGEFLAIVHALAWQEQMGYFVPIYSDSRNAIRWVQNKVCKTKLPRDDRTEELFRHIDRAILWLQRHDLTKYDLRKWPTEVLGEIPADFGRK